MSAARAAVGATCSRGSPPGRRCGAGGCAGPTFDRIRERPAWFGDPKRQIGETHDSAPEPCARVIAKNERSMLRSGIQYDNAAALEWFEVHIIARLRNDDGTRVFARDEPGI